MVISYWRFTNRNSYLFISGKIENPAVETYPIVTFILIMVVRCYPEYSTQSLGIPNFSTIFCNITRILISIGYYVAFVYVFSRERNNNSKSIHEFFDVF